MADNTPRYGRRGIQPDQLARVPYCRLTHSANQNALNTTLTTVAFDTARWDPFGMKSGNTLVIRRAGWYDLKALATWESTWAGDAYVAINHSRDGLIGIDRKTWTATTTFPSHLVATEWYCLVGDVLTVVAGQASGATRAIQKLANYSPEFSARWAGNL